MAASAADGVVDQDLRVFGTDNLYVAGAAALPSGSYANPTLTALGLALRLVGGIGSRGQFGFLRDDKNIDLVIRALPQLAGAHLLIAGAEHPGSRPASPDREFAGALGVADRRHFRIGFHDAAAAADVLAASDVLMLAHSAAIAAGVRALLAGPPRPERERYDREQSWRRNAEIVLARRAAAAPR